jgi:mannose-6-phosphate isomerase-like protein (cupin superfamily)
MSKGDNVMTDKVSVREKFSKFNEHFTPKIVGEMNGNYVLLAKVKGEFVWHTHEEDEFFLVFKGRLRIRLRDRDVILDEGDFFIVPKGVEHMPVAEEEVHLMMVEPTTTKHTGDIVTERTVTNYERI